MAATADLRAIAVSAVVRRCETLFFVSPSSRRVLVTGWFSFEQMGASAGDLLARDVVLSWLAEAGFECEIATAPPFSGGVDWRSTDPAEYEYVVFVCGPAGNGPPLVEFFRHFEAARVIGVNLTMLQPLESWNPFVLLLERDSSRQSRPDLTLLSKTPRVPVVGLILVHKQLEYPGSRVEDANVIIERFLEGVELSIVKIDTRLDQNQTGLRTPAEVESLISKMDVVITTRLHGAVLALKNGVPPVVIDSVEGGAKVSKQARTLGWPAVIPVEGLSVKVLASAFEYCLTPEARDRVHVCRLDAEAGLQSTREEFLDFLRAKSSTG